MFLISVFRSRSLAYTGRAARKRGTYFRLQVYELREGISLVEVYKTVGKSVIWVCGLKRLKDEFYGFKMPRKRSIFVIDSRLKDSAFTAGKRDAKF